MITFEEASAILRYEPETGLLFWKVGGSGRRAGDIAGFRHNRGYWSLESGGKGYLAHRIAWLLIHGVWPEKEIDHINGVRDDNRLINLREVTGAQNCQNKRKPRRDNTTGLLGVRPMGRKWQARIMTNGKAAYLGTYETPQLAAEAYLQAKRIQHETGTI